MFKKNLLALALMSSALSASAAVQAFDWFYKGFMDDNGFSPDRETSGRFLVDDRNGDGTFSVNELVSFMDESHLDDAGRRPAADSGRKPSPSQASVAVNERSRSAV